MYFVFENVISPAIETDGLGFTIANCTSVSFTAKTRTKNSQLLTFNSKGSFFSYIKCTLL